LVTSGPLLRQTMDLLSSFPTPPPPTISDVSNHLSVSLAHPLESCEAILADLTLRSSSPDDFDVPAVLSFLHARSLAVEFCATLLSNPSPPDPYDMSKAGDLPGLQEFAAAHPEFDFVSSRDAFQSSCLYYGCHCGAIKTPQIVFWLLSKGTYSERELARCRDNGEPARARKRASLPLTPSPPLSPFSNQRQREANASGLGRGGGGGGHA
jgi:hypothetical protein